MSSECTESSRGPRVSVCLLVYNDAGSLEETVHSILAQTLPDFEFIISDDCSTDGTWDVVLNLAKQHPNIRAIQTPTNAKMCGNANYAASHATGDYIALLHHGDVYRNDLLEKWLGVMERHSSVAFVFNDTALKPTTATKKPAHGSCKGRNFTECMAGRQFLENELLNLKEMACIVWGTTMIRRTCWESAGGMREEFGALADVDLWMRLAARWDVGYVDAPLFMLQNIAERPDYYPDIYKSLWPRKKLSYAVYASNIARHYANSGSRYWWKWLLFRARVSMETCKWLTYAVVRKRPDMIRQSIEADCPWEFAPVRWYRNCLIWANQHRGTIQANPGAPNG